MTDNEILNPDGVNVPDEAFVPEEIEIPEEVLASRKLLDDNHHYCVLRMLRDGLLRETDIFALSDRVMTAEMAAYRQALRDLPANTTDPANPVWPTKP